MSRIPLWTRCQLVLAAPFWAHIGASAYFIPLGGYEYGFLLPRMSDCASGYSACTGSNLPSNFCCTSGATCQVLAGNTTIVCCPSGEDCDTIYPISCNLTEQNADLYPKSGVKTTALTGTLESCGSTCCPFGYSCSSDVCTKDADQSEAPATTSSASTSTTTSSATSASTSAATVSTSASTAATTSTTAVYTSAEIPTVVVVTTIKSTTETMAVTTTASSSSTTTDAAGVVAASSTSTSTSASASTSSSSSSASSGSSSSSKKSSIIGGVVGGVAGLLLIGAAVWFFMGYRVRRRNQPKNEKPEPSNPKLNRSTSSFGNIINNPLPISSPKLQSCTTFRSDFIRKTPAIPSSNTPPSTVNALVPVPPIIENSNREPRGESPSPGNRQAARQDTPALRPIRGMRNSPPQWQRQQSPAPPPPTQQRQSESGGEEINVGVDPSIMAHSGLNVGIYQSSLPQPPPAIRDPNNNAPQKQPSNERLTTFTTMMKEADLNLERYVADTPHSSPEAGRK